MMDRPPSPEDLRGMARALELARAAAAKGEVPVGAVVIRAGKELGAAHNETILRSDPTAHAELLALQQALQCDGTGRLSGATLYVTLEPCAQCAGAIVLSRPDRLCFGAWDDKAGMAGSLHDLVRHPKLNHRIAVHGGLFAEEAATLLQDFFRARRA